jgi:hypothetical protein
MEMIDDTRLIELDMRLEKAERCINSSKTFKEFKQCEKSRHGIIDRPESHRRPFKW